MTLQTFEYSATAEDDNEYNALNLTSGCGDIGVFASTLSNNPPIKPGKRYKVAVIIEEETDE